MKRILFFLFIQISVIFSLMADDGVCNDVEFWSYGHIYADGSNNKIALEKELMLCRADSITAIFVFKNTTQDTVIVDCAFPVNVDFLYTINKKDSIQCSYPFSSQSESTLRLLLGTKDTFNSDEVKGYEGYIDFNDRVYQLVLKHDKELRVKSKDEYFKYIDSLQFYQDDYMPNCNVEQDGRPVDILNVGIESRVSDSNVIMNFHYHHKLTFAPNAYSKVIVKYSIMSRGCTQFGCCYDISTGGTWKGNINSFMAFVSDGIIKSELDTFKFEKWNSTASRYEIAYKKNYKPHKDEYFHFTFGEDEGEAHGYYDIPEYKDLQTLKLKDVKPSSSWSNVEAMMDKDRFTSCAITDWQNATMEFTLTQNAYGPYMYNGIIGKSTTRENFEAYVYNVKKDQELWGENADLRFYFPKDSTIDEYSNVAKIFIEKLEAPFDTFSFTVNFTDPRGYPFVFDWSRFNDIKQMKYFSAGRYRLSIKGIKEGWKYKDTTRITEFCFLEIPKDVEDMILKDKNSRFPIFQNAFDFFDESLYFRAQENNPIQESSTDKIDKIIEKQYVKSDINNKQEMVDEGETDYKLFVIGGVLILLLIGGGVWMIKKR